MADLEDLARTIDRIIRTMPENLGEPELSTLARALIDRLGHSRLEVAPDGSIVSVLNGKPVSTIIDPTGQLAAETARVRYTYANYAAMAAGAINAAIAGKIPSPATQNFFSAYDGVNKVFTRNPSCIFSWPSYVSCWNSANADGTGGNRGCVTMVTPTQGVTNNHFVQPYAAGVVHYFLGTDGVNYPLTVASAVQIGTTDIQLVTFTAAAPAAVGVASVLAPGVPASVLPAGTPLLATNQAKQAIISQFAGVTGGVVSVGPANGSYAAWTANPLAVDGDSDSPTFAPLDGQLVLLCTYTTPSTGPSYADNLAAINAALSPGTSVSVLALNTLGTAAALNAGSAPGNVPLLNGSGQIDADLLPGTEGTSIVYSEQLWDGTADVTVLPATTVLTLTASSLAASRSVTLPSSGVAGQIVQIVLPGGSTGTARDIAINLNGGVDVQNIAFPSVYNSTSIYTYVYSDGRWEYEASFARQGGNASFSGLATGSLETSELEIVNSLFLTSGEGQPFGGPGFLMLGLVNGNLTAVTLAPGQSARLNAAGTALEAFTPS